MVILQAVWENCIRILEEEKHRQLRMFFILGKKVKEIGILIDKLKCEKSKTVRTPKDIAAVAESVREAPHVVNSETSLRRILHKVLGMTPYKVQLVQELKSIYHPMRYRFANWACDRLPEKKFIFWWSLFWSCGICKQAKLSHLGHRKPARIYRKVEAPKTSHCLVPFRQFFFENE